MASIILALLFTIPMCIVWAYGVDNIKEDNHG